MNDGATTDGADHGTPAVLPQAEPVYRMSGYCAGCGTWDAHGASCLSCGYAFAAEMGETQAGSQ